MDRAKKIGPEGPTFKFYNFDLLEIYIVKYPSIWIKNEWKEEGGKAGVWVGYENVIKRFEWDDLCLEEESFFLGQANSN